jgi:hypothetical protein
MGRDQRTRDYAERRTTEDKSKKDITRCLKRYVAREVFPIIIRSVKAKIRALTRRTSQQDLGYVLRRLNQIRHGWANYFRHAVAQRTFDMLDNFTWWRAVESPLRGNTHRGFGERP